MVLEFNTQSRNLSKSVNTSSREAAKSRQQLLVALAFVAQAILGRQSAEMDQYLVWRIRVALRSPCPARTTGVDAVCPCVISLRWRNRNDSKQTSPHRCCVLLAEPSRRTWFHHSCSTLRHKARPTTMRPVHIVATGSCRGKADGLMLCHSKCARAKSGWFPSFPCTFNLGWSGVFGPSPHHRSEIKTSQRSSAVNRNHPVSSCIPHHHLG